MANESGGRSSRGFTRRSFLKGSAVGAGVAVGGDAAFFHGLASASTNTIVAENQLPGTDDDWDVYADPSIEGFSTEHSVNAGETIDFKIRTDATSYVIKIYRIGWYGGKGARKVGQVNPSVPLPQVQPEPFFEPSTRTTDCGNWAVSASWAVPASAVSGVYVANLERTDGSTARNRITFVVRNDGRASDILVQTADSTYQAYNDWGGYGLYTGAQKVSYNRPYDPQEIENEFYYAEQPLVRWLERNGYDVAYCGSADVDSRPQELMSRKILVSSGHDEYWSGAMRANYEAARDAGINLIFMAGNEVFWKVRWENSMAGPSTARRTLVCYKETLANAKIDPSAEWTGTWRDPRFSPPSNGGRPENELIGTIFKAINPNAATDFAIKVPHAYSGLRIWRNTSIADLEPNETAVLAAETLGYEWNTDADNGHRPGGLIRMSETTEVAEQVLQDFGGTYVTAPLTHYLTMYRAASGALVWSTGTVQWSWGLDDYHLTNPNPAPPPDVRMQQATLNVLADMGVQPMSRQPELVPATASTDSTPPTSAITAPAAGTSYVVGTPVTVTGTAVDSGGVVAGVEVSVDGGATWHAAVGTSSWSYTFTINQVGSVVVMVRAIDDSCNVEVNGPQLVLDGLGRPAPLSIWPDGTVPQITSSGDPAAYELGLKFRTSRPGFISALKFYKGAGNTGPHTGRLWQADGTLLATASYDDETPSGWQIAPLAQPVPIAADTTYVVSYTAPNGNYALDPSGLTEAFELAPMRALAAGDDGPNGVFGGPGGFPTQTFGSTNYWVDVVFDDDDGLSPTVVDLSPARDVSSVDQNSVLVVKFSEPVDASSASLSLVDGGGSPVVGTLLFNPGDRSFTLTPAAPLLPSTTYTANISGVTDLAGNPMLAPVEWSFTTAAPVGSLPTSVWTSAAVPAVASAADPSPIELGVRFRSAIDALVTAVRYYRGPSNVGSHVGRLWDASGVLLSTAVFTDESASGWQEARFPEPVPITANTTYVVSYYAPNGGYAVTPDGFGPSGVARGPLEALSNAEAAGNGVYSYVVGGGYPTTAFGASNYWVDVVIDRVPDTTPPQIVNQVPAPSLHAVDPTQPVTVVFDEPVAPESMLFELRDSGNSIVPGAVVVSGASATLTPAAPLANGATYSVTVRATDLVGLEMPAPISWSFTTTSEPNATPATLFDTSVVPAISGANDPSSVELGMRFTAERNGLVTAIRFYKDAENTGQHTGRLWTAAGELLASVVFANESGWGWQEQALPNPVALQPGDTYVVSYHAPNGRYSSTEYGFDVASSNPPLYAFPNTASSRNGVYSYGSGGFPTSSYHGSNYYVDVVFVDNVGPQVVAQVPASGSVNVDPSTPIAVDFSEPIRAASVQVELRDGGGAVIPVTTSSPSTTQVVVQPSIVLANDVTYTLTVLAAEDLSGNPLVAQYNGTLTTQAATLTSLFGAALPAVASANDPSAIELGMKFQVTEPSEMVGVRFYQGPANVGPHIGRLYDANGVLLAEAGFGTDGNGGWRSVNFAAPVALAANTTYVVSYFTESGNYAVDGGFFANPATNGSIVGLASGASGGNGVYRYGGGYPTGTYNDGNYWVDVLVRPMS